MTTCVTYSRVSTAEQRERGYSLRQQKEALRAYCLNEGWEIVAEAEDGGHSGASLERPGLDRVQDLVAGGGIDLVVAQDRDRFAREPAYLYLLRKEFSERGTRLRALNDRGDDSPEGELTDGILDHLAKFERAKIAERSRRRKMQKAREGKVIAGHTPNYGFRYNGARDGYVVHELEMEMVRRIFRMVGAEGASMHGVCKALDREGVPTPQTPRKAKHPEERRWWSKRTIRDIIEDDCYRPHAHEEIAPRLSPDVAARLDSEASYGVWWFGRRHNTHERVAEVGADGTRDYRLRQKTAVKPREQWIAVPVPDAGVPGALVEAARARIRDRAPTPSTGDRLYELRGVLFCEHCGSRMATNRVLQPGTKRPAHFYRCPKRQHLGKEACPNGRHLRAEGVEALVWGAVEEALSRGRKRSRPAVRQAPGAGARGAEARPR
jgi:site-specific DNA recombinase